MLFRGKSAPLALFAMLATAPTGALAQDLTSAITAPGLTLSPVPSPPQRSSMALVGTAVSAAAGAALGGWGGYQGSIALLGDESDCVLCYLGIMAGTSTLMATAGATLAGADPVRSLGAALLGSALAVGAIGLLPESAGRTEYIVTYAGVTGFLTALLGR